MRDKKGQVNTLAPAILALVFAAIVLVFGIIIVQSLRDVDTLNDIAVTITNETVATVNFETATAVAHATKCGFSAFSVTEAINETGNVIVPATNYTAVAATGTIIFIGTDAGENFGFNNTDWDVTYTYKWGDTACEQANLTVVGLGTFADFWEIIVLAVIISIVIGLLLVIFGGASGRRR